MSGLRVLGLATSYPLSETDSTAPFIRAICHGIARRGAEVELLVPQHPELHWPEGDPPVRLRTFRYLPVRAGSLHLWGYGGALQADESVRPVSWALAPLAGGSSLAKLALEVRRFGPDVVHAHWALPNAPIAATVARLSGLPLVVSLHGSGVFLAERFAPLGKLAGRALRSASRVTACSSDLRERALALGAPPDRTARIPYGVDEDRFRPGTGEDRAWLGSEFDLAGDRVVLLAVGRLVAKKGFRYLLDALEILRSEGRPVSLLLAGSGDLDAPLRRRARESGLGTSVRFLGDVGRDRLHRLYRGADALVVPSIRDAAGNVDGLPNVLLEGMASGLPVVASRVAGIPDVVQDGENGLLVAEKDPRELAEALERIIRRPELRQKLGDSARSSVLERLTWDHITGRYHEVLRESVGASPRSGP